MKTLNEWRDTIHAWACRKGWWTNPALPAFDETPRSAVVYADENDKSWRNVGELLMLVTTELAEAMEDYRTGKMKTYMDSSASVYNAEGNYVEKPCGFPSEIADAMIRLLDLCGALDIDINHEIEIKMRYNESRAHRHGGKRA